MFWVLKLPYLFAYKPSDFGNKLNWERKYFRRKKFTGAEQDLKFNVYSAISRAIIKHKFPTSQWLLFKW